MKAASQKDLKQAGQKATRDGTSSVNPGPAAVEMSGGMEPAEPDDREVVLLAVTGMSPAVLTETIWALAHPVDGSPLVVPHRVITVTTAEGKRMLSRLFEPSDALGGAAPWEALRTALEHEGLPAADRLRFGRTGDDIRVITRVDPTRQESEELADIRTGADNEAAANFLLDQVRGLVENPDTRLIVSIAGGRKTMSALLYACMTLVGRETDALTHVLVSEPYEGLPGFWFPGQPGGPVMDPSGVRHDPARARVELAWVPFVSLRQFLVKELGRKPGTFTRLVELCRRQIRRRSAEDLKLTLDTQRSELEVNGVRINLAPAEMLMFLFLALRAKRNEPAFPSYKDALDELNAFREEQRELAREHPVSWRGAGSLQGVWDEHDLARAVASVRQKLRDAGGDASVLSDCLPSKGRCSLDVPGSLIYVR